MRVLFESRKEPSQLPSCVAYIGLILLACGTIAEVAPLHDPILLNREWLESSEGIDKLGKCLPTEDIPTDGKNLTAKELGLLSTLCWRKDMLNTGRQLRSVNRGIPAGVKCKATKWCDEADSCSEVCERGSVQLSPWLQNGLKTQLALSRKLSMCNATLPGSHNSAIDLADGYGNLDAQFQEYFVWIRWVADSAQLRTNDHYFSLTDQMNMGVRAVELDTHEVEGALRIAHCGGYHGDIDVLIQAVNLVAKLLGHPIHWDSETIGCNPSLSSIPVLEQRTFLSALQEISAWLELPGNEHEFLVLYLDDQPDLLDWGVLPELFLEIHSIFSLPVIFTPLELESEYNGTWPSIDQLSVSGKKVLFVTGADYGPVIDPIMFSKEGRKTVCGWTEPDFHVFVGEPECLATGNPYTGETLAGKIFRVITCELYYGPMNCNFEWSSSNDPLLDESSLPEVSRCGLNMPSPDLLTPSRAAATIWSWAPDHPFPDTTDPPSILQSMLRVWKTVLNGFRDPQDCAFIARDDGRWRTGSCTMAGPTACRLQNGTWLLQDGDRGACPEGSSFAVPSHSKENTALQMRLQNSSFGAAWLPLQGPDWKVAGSLLYASNSEMAI